MIVDELIKELQTFPPDWPVKIEVNGTLSEATDVDMESTKSEVWVLIHDYHTELPSSRSYRS